MIPFAVALALGLSPVMTQANELHTVKAGDTLWGISQTYDVSVNNIKSWNNLNNNILYVGQKLVVETTKNESNSNQIQTYTVKSGDSLYAIALNHNVSVADIQNWNNMKTTVIYVGQKLQLQTKSTTPSTPPTTTTPKPTAPTVTTTYTVKSGDTLYSISRAYNVSVADLRTWNNLTSDVLKVGQKLGVGQKANEPTTTTQKVGTVKADTLNVRSGAGTTHSIVGSLKNNATVTVLEEKNGWAHIQYEKIKGWVSLDYLTVKTTEVPVKDVPKEEIKEKTKYQVNASALNVRKDPSTGNNLIETIPNGTIVEELERKGTWSYIQYGAKKGWVSNEFLKKTTTSVAKGKTVVIDPGHGGADSGALGSYGFNEEHANLAIGLLAEKELKARGYNVAMVRTGDYECSKGASTTSELKCRVEFTTNNKGDIFVSIHNNSATPAARGTETYYTSGKNHSAESLRLANSVHKYIQPAFGSLDRKVKDANYYVTRENTVPAILLEVGFMSNPDDLAKLKSTTYQDRVAKAIANGIDEYFGF